jgi:hypothetical protein
MPMNHGQANLYRKAENATPELTTATAALADIAAINTLAALPGG